MDDQVLMRVADRVADGGKELESAIEREVPCLAVAVDRLAFHELHCEIWESTRGDAAIDETCDARVLEQGEDAALLDEASHDTRGGVLNELEGHPLVELAISAFAEEHSAHAAAADLAYDAEGSDAIGDRSGEDGGRLENGCGNLDGW